MAEPDERPRLRGSASTPIELNRAEQIQDARAAELALVRTAASKWQAGLAVLLGTITASWSFAFGQEIREIETRYAVPIVAFLCVAVLAALHALFMSLRAAGGIPKARRTKSLDVEAVDHEEAVSAAGLLSVAIFWSVIALGLYLSVVVATWFAPRQAEPTTVHIIETENETLCGDVNAIVVDAIFLTTVDGDSIRIPLIEVSALNPARKCP